MYIVIWHSIFHKIYHRIYEHSYRRAGDRRRCCRLAGGRGDERLGGDVERRPSERPRRLELLETRLLTR